MNTGYNPDLAYIHDVGFGDYAHQSMPGILAVFRQYDLQSGLVVDLGCGSGISAQALTQAGYSVLGIDLSPAMIAIAQERVPQAEFRVTSLFTADLPACDAVISIGECLCYRFDDNTDPVLETLFRRVFAALNPGGVFLFDVVVPGQVAPGAIVKSFTEGPDWIVLVEKHEDLIQQILTRRIVTLRQVGELYRKTEEVHHQRLFNTANLVETLNQIGFEVTQQEGYGQFCLPPARIAFVAYKPG